MRTDSKPTQEDNKTFNEIITQRIKDLAFDNRDILEYKKNQEIQKQKQIKDY